MSLISDPDFLIHSLRLSYLRNVDDQYGPRLVSLNPSYASNPFIVAASLADTRRWPELHQTSSPNISDDEGERPSGFPGATGLKYTQTIMGPSRSGGLGLRTSARRASTSKRVSATPRQLNGQNLVIVDEDSTLNDTPLAAIPQASKLAEHRGELWVNAIEILDPGEQPPMNGPAPVETSTEVAPKEVLFIPRFKGAAEMEARRKMRMQARRQIPPVIETKPATPISPVNPELSSSEEEDSSSMEDEDPFDGLGEDSDDSMGDGDEFDPDFAATRTPGANSGSASEIMSLHSTGSTSNSSILANPNLRTRSQLSPVSETKVPQDKNNSTALQKGAKSSGSYFEMVAPVPRPDHPHRKPEHRARTHHHVPSTVSESSPEITFTRRAVLPIRPLQSSLTAMMASSGTSANPFAELYGAISGRAEVASMKVSVFFPHSREPSGKAMELSVRKDATIEEVVGFSLWTYWEEGWLPKLDEGLSGEDDPKWATRLSAVGWILRIAEEDGEVDDEFPSPDRTGKISKFNFDAYAVLEATPAQIQQNQILESKIQRPATMASKKSALLAPSGTAITAPAISGTETTTTLNSTLGSVPLSTSLGLSSSHGPLIFLRIRVADTADAVHVSTTIPVSSGTYMQEALELVCRKRKLANPKDYAFLLGDMSLLIPLDRTVQSLAGKKDLVLVKRSTLPHLGVNVLKDLGKATDPNASIFSTSDVQEVPHTSAMDVTAAYKKYTIYRKLSMLARTERTLAIDGGYVHIMPSTNRAKAVFDSGKTSSYHIKCIVGCQQSVKSSSIFKLMVQRGKVIKRYEYEAESPQLAGEIVQTVRSLKTQLDRSGTVTKSRRSRQVV